MTRYFLLVCLFFIPGLSFFADTETSHPTHVSVKSPLNEISWQALYQEMRLDSIIEPSAFEQAVAGYYKIKNKKREILTLIDFSKASTEKRLFVFDMKNHKLLFSSLVAHGKNSGDKYATSFSTLLIPSLTNNLLTRKASSEPSFLIKVTVSPLLIFPLLILPIPSLPI